MNGRRRWLVVAIGAIAITSAAAGAPSMLRRVDAFNVNSVEIRGTHYLAAYDAIAQSGITKHSSVFDDFAPWRARLLKHPLVLDAKIERRLPNTLRVTVTETEPVALVRTPELRPVDGRGKALPVDPATVDLDVPLIAGRAHPNAAGEFADAPTRQVIDVLTTLKRRDARLFAWISEAGALRDGVRLELRNPAGAEVLTPPSGRALKLHEIEVAIADLAARGELQHMKRIDARYHDQIVVALNGK